MKVCRFTPARPYAGGMSVALVPLGPAVFPSRNIEASNLPGPQPVSTPRTVASSTPSSAETIDRSGAAAMIWPTSRSRAGQPSSRWPMPAVNESSTVE